MRITGGAFKGRRLHTPPTRRQAKNTKPARDQAQRVPRKVAHDIRPTADRTREALFAILENLDGAPAMAGANVIDLYAGTGTLGLEALSRGARHATFVEMDADARGLIRANIETLGLEGQATLLRRDARRLGPSKPGMQCHFAFADPPYGYGLADKSAVAMLNGNWLACGAIVVIEERRGTAICPPAEFEALFTRDYGETSLFFFRYATEPTVSTAQSAR
ncbi:MAG: 16S rRNA (guanine(966)-N(2))-methyltransferase RsmD [Pseudomonadota bacterium]